MTRRFMTPALLALLWVVPGVAQAACTAEFKAKQDDPLRLRHDTAQVASCDMAAATQELRDRLAQEGWILLKIISLKE